MLCPGLGDAQILGGPRSWSYLNAVLPRRPEFKPCEDAPGISVQQGKKEELFKTGEERAGGLGESVQKKKSHHQNRF